MKKKQLGNKKQTTFNFLAVATNGHFLCLQNTLEQRLKKDGTLLVQKNVQLRRPQIPNFQKATESEKVLIKQLKLVNNIRPYELVPSQSLTPCLAATSFIREGSLLCEFTGEVRMFKKEEEEEEDSGGNFVFFEKDSQDNSWGLVNKRYANESKYLLLCEIKDKNCEKVGRMVNGFHRLFVVTTKNINKGEILYLFHGKYFQPAQYRYRLTSEYLLTHLSQTQFLIQASSQEKFQEQLPVEAEADWWEMEGKEKKGSAGLEKQLDLFKERVLRQVNQLENKEQKGFLEETLFVKRKEYEEKMIKDTFRKFLGYYRQEYLNV